jgi:hypothetical protein
MRRDGKLQSNTLYNETESFKQINARTDARQEVALERVA